MGILTQTLTNSYSVVNRHPLRSVLMVLGLSVSVGSAVTIDSIQRGGAEAVRDELEQFANTIYIWPLPRSDKGVRSPKGWALTLTVDDAEELKQRNALLVDTCWGRRDPAQVVYGHSNRRVPIEGNAASCFLTGRWRVARGTFFTQEEVAAAARVAVIGNTVSDDFYGRAEDPIGTILRIRSVPFKVIGVLAPKGYLAGADWDDVIIIPFTAAQRYVQKPIVARAVEEISTATLRRDDLAQAVAEIREILRARHQIGPEQADDFKITTALEYEHVADATNGILMVFGVTVSLLALICGCTGLINLFLLSVSERKREIGLRLAVGGTPGHILSQFLVEAAMLSVLGGSLGLGFGLVGAWLASVLGAWPVVISPLTIMGAILLSMIIGLLCGLHPAIKAARLSPIDALRGE